MTRRKEPEPALAAPGLEGPLSILVRPLAGPRGSRRARSRPYAHVHFEIDLALEPRDPSGIPLLERLAGLVQERRIVERGTLVRMAGATLHAMASRRFRRVDHWEVHPGGWLPLPRRPSRADQGEPVGDLITSLESDAWQSVRAARTFSARLSDLSGARVDFVVRRVHRERRHALSLDLWGTWTPVEVDELTGAIHERLPVVRTTMTKFKFA